MRRAKIFLLLALTVCTATFLRAATATNSLAWHNATGQVDADVHGEALWPLLEDIAHQTGWHIFMEPGITQATDAKFSSLPSSEALRKLLGDLNFALVPKTNEPSQLYVFTTRMENATRPVRAAEKLVVTKQKHVANELIVKLKPGADIDAIAKSIGAKVVGRDDKLGIYRLQFPDAAATDAALAKLQSNSDVAAVEYNYILDPPVTPQKIANAPVGPVSLTLNPPGDSGRVIVGLVDTHLQSMGSDLDQFMLKQISITGDTPVDSTDPTHATSMAETILRAMAAQGGSTSAQILSVDVYGNSETATTWNLLLGIQQAINAGANPINLSLGGTGESTIMRDFIEQAVGKGIIFIAAAGNQPVSTPTLPAAFPGVYAVAATQGGQLAAYSNFGSFIAMALPGSSVVYLGNQAFLVQGTSPATAYATGIAAGTKSATSMTWAQILTAMQQKFPVPTK